MLVSRKETNMAKVIMVQGTMSNAGKSLIWQRNLTTKQVTFQMQAALKGNLKAFS